MKRWEMNQQHVRLRYRSDLDFASGRGPPILGRRLRRRITDTLGGAEGSGSFPSERTRQWRDPSPEVSLSPAILRSSPQRSHGLRRPEPRRARRRRKAGGGTRVGSEPGTSLLCSYCRGTVSLTDGSRTHLSAWAHESTANFQGCRGLFFCEKVKNPPHIFNIMKFILQNLRECACIHRVIHGALPIDNTRVFGSKC